jgi:hypothetical protein
LNKLKEEAETRFETECTFQPAKKKIEKYVICGGDVIRRNEIWYNSYDIGSFKNEKDRQETKSKKSCKICMNAPSLRISSPKNNPKYTSKTVHIPLTTTPATKPPLQINI